MRKGTATGFFHFSVAPSIFIDHFRVLKRFIQNISEIPEMDLKMWEAVLREPPAMCQFVSEMNLQLVNIIEKTITNLADFCHLIA